MFFKISPVQLFADTYYPGLHLHPKMIEQMMWLQGNSVNTSQSSVVATQENVNIEVKRILSRLNTLTLLTEGDYETFTQAQGDDKKLSEERFNLLSRFIRELTPDSRSCLMATCFITKSDQAIKTVPGKLPADSEQFITCLVTEYAHLLPICDLLTPEAIKLLPFAFYKNSHARQMLDMEGGYNMVSPMAEAIRTRKITWEQYNLWFARWIINIAGLDGHVNPRGSIYLTEPVAQCIFALKSELDQLWINPNHQVIDNYLAFRAEQLGLKITYTAYLGALMRQYSPVKGHEIQAWFDGLTPDVQQKKLDAFTLQMKNTRVTPTFKPTVLVNLLDLKCTVSEALDLFSDIEAAAMHVYVTGQVSPDTALSYRNVAFKENLSPIRAYYERHQALPELTINAEVYLSVPAEALSCSLVMK